MVVVPTVALVHKERNILTSIRLACEAAGFAVRTFGDGESALESLTAVPADIGIIGRSMPRLSGPDLFARLRQSTPMPVIFLSSFGEDLADQVQGADDYLFTCCSHKLLVSRVHAVLRRHRRNGLVVDSAHCRCTWRQARVYLNMPEFLILEALARRGVHTRFALMAAAYGPDLDMDADLIDHHIAAMQNKFRDIDPSTKVIECVSGVAYRLGRWV